MMKDAVATMGGLLPDDAGGRDAVHVAVFSARSPVKVFPGQDIAIVDAEPVEHGDTVVSPVGGMLIGIVDPFLKVPAMPGERFWAYLYPRTITSLAHKWGHPAFQDVSAGYAPPTSKLISEQWLRDFCADSDCPGYEEVLGKASRVADGRRGSDWDNEYLHFDGQDAHGEIPPEFWDHVAIVLGREIKGPRPIYFSCSC